MAVCMHVGFCRAERISRQGALDVPFWVVRSFAHIARVLVHPRRWSWPPAPPNHPLHQPLTQPNNQPTNHSEKSIKAFAKDLIDGKLTPEYKSGPIPEEPTDGGVAVRGALQRPCDLQGRPPLLPLLP